MKQSNFNLAFKFALREMRGGISGFYIFIACIALGTAAIAGVNSISQTISHAIELQGRELLGADIRLQLQNRTANDNEEKHLASLGTLSKSSTLRSMARLPDGSDQTLVEIKAVDSFYPLYGKFGAVPDQPLDQLLDMNANAHGVLVAPIFLTRLNVSVGDIINLGKIKLQIRGTIEKEPDALSDGFGFAPRLLITKKALKLTALLQAGSLVSHQYKIKLHNQNASQAAIMKVVENLKIKFPEAGWSIRTNANAAPALSNNIDRFSQFLTLVGLTSLVVGGVGVGNAVRAFINAKIPVIATFKSLGASNRLVFTIYLIQVMLIAILGIAIGLVLGALSPLAAANALSGVLPIATNFIVFPMVLAQAALFGILTAASFAILPLGRAVDVPATALFREARFNGKGLPSLGYIALVALLGVSLIALAITTSANQFVAAIFLGAVGLSFILLRGVAIIVEVLAKKSPRVASTSLRMAIANIHRPGALTPAVILSLGLGLTLLVTLSLIDTNLRREITNNIPERAPSFFFVDIQSHQLDDFSNLLTSKVPDAKVIKVPMLRGRILSFNGVDISKMTVPAGGQWVLRGDRGITYSKRIPENSTLSKGKWWDADYQGEPLVSFSSEEANELGLKINDTVTVNILGRNITARIASLRDVSWETLSINFVMVFSPNTFAGAPHAWLATLSSNTMDSKLDGEVLRAVTSAFPTITTVRVKDAIDLANRLVSQLASAIRAAAAVALLSSLFVLAGALAASNKARIYDAVILKTLGATRITLIKALIYEYIILGSATAFFALVAGSISSWFVLNQIMNLPSSFLPDVAAITLLVSLIITVGIGLAGTWKTLGQKAAPILRDL